MEKRDELIVTASAMIVDGRGRIFLTLRPGPPRQGYWHLPSGTLKFGETLHQALRRGVWEDVALSVEPVRLQPLFVGQTIIPDEALHIIDTFFAVKTVSQLVGRAKVRCGYFYETEVKDLKILDSCRDFLHYLGWHL